MKKYQRGFSIIEAMVAALVLGLGLIGAAAMQVNMGLATQLSRQRAEATLMANNQIEIARAKGACTALAATKQAASVQANTEYTLGIVCGPPMTVTVTWNDARGGQTQVGGADNRVVLVSQL